MIKNKIKEIIYSEELTDVEREDWFLGVDEDGDWLYNWEEIYESRIITMAEDIKRKGASSVLDVNELFEKLDIKIIKFIRTLTNDWYSLKEIDKLLKA